MEMTREAGVELIVEIPEACRGGYRAEDTPSRGMARHRIDVRRSRRSSPGLDIVNDDYDPRLKEARPKRLAAGCTARPRSSRSRR